MREIGRLQEYIVNYKKSNSGQYPEMVTIANALQLSLDDTQKLFKEWTKLHRSRRSRYLAYNDSIINQDPLIQASNNSHTERIAISNQVKNIIRQIRMEINDDLSDREKVIFDERLLARDPKSLIGIGRQLGVSRESIRVAEAGLLKKIKKLLKNRYKIKKLDDIMDF